MKALCLFIAIMFAASASGQVITEKDLTGTWDLVAFAGPDMRADLKSGNLTLSDEVRKQLSDEDFAAAQKEFAESVKGFRQQLIFTEGATVAMKATGKEDHQWKYRLSERDGNQYLYFNGADVKIVLDGSRLEVWTLSGAEKAEVMTYEKINNN